MRTIFSCILLVRELFHHNFSWNCCEANAVVPNYGVEALWRKWFRVRLLSRGTEFDSRQRKL
jgi:hypothetical protein